MTTVLVSAEDLDFWHSLIRLLERHLPLLHLGGGTLAAGEGTPLLALCHVAGLAEIRAREVIAVYRDRAPAFPAIVGARQVVAVVNSGNESLGPAVSSTGFPAVTCGLFAKDTLTLSSITADSAVLDVRRSIQCLDGTAVEPQEIPVRTTGRVDSFTLMAAAAVMMLTGHLPLLLNGKI